MSLEILKTVTSDKFCTKSLYSLLGVSAGASQKEITKAHRRLMLRFHPDKCFSGLAEHSKALNHAFSVLSSPELRAAYDRGGEAGIQRHNQAKAQADARRFRFSSPRQGPMLPPISEALNQLGKGIELAEIELAVQDNDAELDSSLIASLRSVYFEFIGDAVNAAIRCRFRCTQCGVHISGGAVDGICYCLDAAQQTHCNRRRCCVGRMQTMNARLWGWFSIAACWLFMYNWFRNFG